MSIALSWLVVVGLEGRRPVKWVGLDLPAIPVVLSGICSPRLNVLDITWPSGSILGLDRQKERPESAKEELPGRLSKCRGSLQVFLEAESLLTGTSSKNAKRAIVDAAARLYKRLKASSRSLHSTVHSSLPMPSGEWYGSAALAGWTVPSRSTACLADPITRVMDAF